MAAQVNEREFVGSKTEPILKELQCLMIKEFAPRRQEIVAVDPSWYVIAMKCRKKK